MVLVRFTQNLQRHVALPPCEVDGESVREVLEAVFAKTAQARSYILDDQGALRQHMAIFVDGVQVRDRVHLSDPVATDAKVDVMQALSGG